MMPLKKTKTVYADLSLEALELIAARFRVLGEVSRLKLVHALDGSERSVNELLQLTGLMQANASRHLQLLSDAGILDRRKRGSHVLYSVADPDILTLCNHVCGSLRQGTEAHARALVG